MALTKALWFEGGRVPGLGLAILLAAVVTGCAGETSPSPSDVDNPGLLVGGSWHAVLQSPGGPLPFGLEIRADDDGSLQAFSLAAGEEAALGPVQVGPGEDGEPTIRIDTTWYDSEIEAMLEVDELVGRWRKTADDGDSVLPFEAHRDVTTRFAPLENGGQNLVSVAGRWSAVFVDEDGESLAVAEFEQREGAAVTGTFLTPTGDYRYLEGSFEGGRLRLSTFDGAHAFLFDATLDASGALSGGFWSRDTYHATWTATRLAEGAPWPLPDPYKEVGLTNDQGRFAFAFPDVDGGAILSSDDPRFAGKVLIVEVFGSWCPNCNDSAPVLADLYRRHHDHGLEVVGLAFELRGDPERDAVMVRRFKERHDLPFPLLLAGTSDKEAAGETLPDLSAVLSFPTKVFIDRGGRVRRVHSGFAGPGTGAHYQQLVEELEALTAELLAEPVPGDSG